MNFIYLDLSNGSIVIDQDIYSYYDENKVKQSGAHAEDNQYVITTSAITKSNITLKGEGLVCNLTLNNVVRDYSSDGTTVSGGLIIAKSSGENKNITVTLQGENTLGQLFYTGNSNLKITSIDGDGSANGVLNVTARSWSAAIGGHDSDEAFSGLLIAGGTINATAASGAAIGGAGNGAASIKITGGAINAQNSGPSATIGGGGGDSGAGGQGTIYIYGGAVSATNTGTGTAIGGGSSNKNNSVGAANVYLIGGSVTTNVANMEIYGISGGKASNGSFAATNVTVSATLHEAAAINPNATIVSDAIIFDLSKKSIVITPTSYSGWGFKEDVLLEGAHLETNKYVVLQSNNATPTSNTIVFSGDFINSVEGEEGTQEIPIPCYLTLDGINISAKNSIQIGAIKNQRKYITFYLNGINYVNNILYYTGAASDTGNEATRVFSDSTLKFTSVDGDGSTIGVLNVVPSGNSVYYNAAIGGTDNNSYSTNMIFAGGTIKVNASAENDCAAIGGGGNGYAKIDITGGHIIAENNSTGATIGGGVGYTDIGAGCDILISGGIIEAKNNGKFKTGYSIDTYVYGVAIGGGSSFTRTAYQANVTITGGKIRAEVLDGYTAIGGGNSNKSNGGACSITVYGGEIECIGTIGGGKSTKANGGNATVFIDGQNTKLSAWSIGGGVVEENGKLGKANVTINEGVIQSQILMQGEGSSFEMNGGIIDNTNQTISTQPDGGAVYITNGSAVMNNGIIQHCSANNGGAICVYGGDFTMNGGQIYNTSANNGGAIYIEGGDVIMNTGSITYCSAVHKGGAIYLHQGVVTIGRKGCTCTEDGHHSLEDYAHETCPLVENNVAEIGNNVYTTNKGVLYINCGETGPIYRESTTVSSKRRIMLLAALAAQAKSRLY